MGLLQHSICGKEHLKRYVSQYQGGKPQIYSAREVKIVGDVRLSIPHIYATLDNKQAGHQETINEMDGKIFDQVVSILIDLGYNYSYVSHDLADKCGLNK